MATSQRLVSIPCCAAMLRNVAANGSGRLKVGITTLKSKVGAAGPLPG
jgi:hypothetical protein